MNPVPISKMRERVEIQSRTTEKDGYGQPIAEWATVATVAAFIEPQSGREPWQAQQARPDVTHRVTIRHAEGTWAERLERAIAIACRILLYG